MLPVCIHHSDDVTGSGIEPIDNRRAQPLLANATEDTHRGEILRKHLRHAPCSIGGIVIDDDDLVWDITKDSIEEIDESGEILCLVIRRKNER